MIDLRSRTKYNRPMIVFAVTCLSLLPFAAEGLLSNPKILLLTPYEKLLRRRTIQTFPSQPYRECQSKRDLSLGANKDENQYYSTKMELGSETNSLDDESNDIDMSMGDARQTKSQENKLSDDTTPQTLSTPTALLATVLFVSFWPLLALLRSTTSPIDGFDIDMFMALKGIMDTAPMNDGDPTIVELPSLSPAEQLVGAIFGPPQ